MKKIVQGIDIKDCEYIYTDRDYDYWKASVERLKDAQSQLKLF